MPTPNQTTPDSPERIDPIVASVAMQIATMKDGALWNEMIELRMLVAQAISRHESAETTRLAEALKEMAAQKTTEEMDEETFEHGDFEGAHDFFINSARKALLTPPAPISGAKKE